MFPPFTVVNRTVYYVSDMPPKLRDKVILTSENEVTGKVIEVLEDNQYRVLLDDTCGVSLVLHRSTIRALHKVEGQEGQFE